MKHLLALSVLFVLVILPNLLLAQPSLPTDPEQVPIDGGLGILVAIGGTYDIKKLRDRSRD